MDHRTANKMAPKAELGAQERAGVVNGDMFSSQRPKKPAVAEWNPISEALICRAQLEYHAHWRISFVALILDRSIVSERSSLAIAQPVFADKQMY